MHDPHYTSALVFCVCMHADVDECLEENGGCRCNVESETCALCVNTPGSRFCECVDGYALGSDGVKCTGICEMYLEFITATMGSEKNRT